MTRFDSVTHLKCKCHRACMSGNSRCFNPEWTLGWLAFGTERRQRNLFWVRSLCVVGESPCQEPTSLPSLSLAGLGCVALRSLAANVSLLDISLLLLTTLSPLPILPKMFTRGVRPALTVARTASKQQQAGMATLKEIDQRCVRPSSPPRFAEVPSTPSDTSPKPHTSTTLCARG